MQYINSQQLYNPYRTYLGTTESTFLAKTTVNNENPHDREEKPPENSQEKKTSEGESRL